jgi:hypothetical protein
MATVRPNGAGGPVLTAQSSITDYKTQARPGQKSVGAAHPPTFSRP